MTDIEKIKAVCKFCQHNGLCQAENWDYDDACDGCLLDDAFKICKGENDED